MDSERPIYILLPAYRENEVLRNVVESLLPLGHRILVVDDGSPQPLAPLLQDLPVEILRHRCNLGQGAALQTGFEYARQQRARALVSFDADGQHDPADIPQLLQPVLAGEADLVLGSRFLGSIKGPMPFSRRLVLQLARGFNFLLSGLWLSDAHNGLRAFNAKALSEVELTENRMAHASELLFEIKKHRLRWKEVPVHIHYTQYARQKGQSAWQGIRILFDLVLHKLFQ